MSDNSTSGKIAQVYGEDDL